jgi:hypothetical protein
VRRRAVPVDFYNPKGRWHLVAQCSECKQFMHDYAREWVWYQRFSRVPLVATPPRRSTWDHRDICTQCAHLPVSFVERCDVCLATRRSGYFGCQRRSLGWRLTQELNLRFPPDDDDIENERKFRQKMGLDCSDHVVYFEAMRTTPRLCLSCWNKLKPLDDLYSRADDARLLIGRVKRKIHESAKEHT